MWRYQNNKMRHIMKRISLICWNTPLLFTLSFFPSIHKISVYKFRILAKTFCISKMYVWSYWPLTTSIFMEFMNCTWLDYTSTFDLSRLYYHEIKILKFYDDMETGNCLHKLMLYDVVLSLKKRSLLWGLKTTQILWIWY